MTRQREQRGKGVGAAQREGGASVRGKRLGHQDYAVQSVCQRESRRDVERQMQVDAAEDSAEHRPENEAEAERRSDQSEAPRAPLGRGDIGCIRARDREARARDPADHAREQHEPQRRREREKQIVQAQSEDRCQDDGSPPEAIGKRAEQRRAAELHQAVNDDQRAIPIRLELAARRVIADEHGQHGHRQPDTEHVEEDDDENEGQRGGTARCGW